VSCGGLTAGRLRVFNSGMAVNAFLTFFDKADGESIQRGKEKWVELLGWDWEVEAEVREGKGGGAKVGKPRPGKLNWEHYFDTSSAIVMGTLCNGKAFPQVELQMTRTMLASVKTISMVTTRIVPGRRWRAFIVRPPWYWQRAWHRRGGRRG